MSTGGQSAQAVRPATLPKFWSGRLTGTNRGRVVAQISERKSQVTGRAIFWDYAAGPLSVRFFGKLDGACASLKLKQFKGLAPGLTPHLPLRGEMTLSFNDAFTGAKGKWNTDIGTNGAFKIEPLPLSRIEWWRLRLRLGASYLRLALRAHMAWFYSVFLLAVFALYALGLIRISYPSVILLLIPAPYVLRNPISELIHLWGVTKFGPVELQRPIGDELRRLIAQQVQDAARFLYLDTFLVPRTKLILYWLFSYGEADRPSFDAVAAQIGVPPENLENTWNALAMSGCARVEGEKVVITDLGRRYVGYLTGQGSPPSVSQ